MSLPFFNLSIYFLNIASIVDGVFEHIIFETSEVFFSDLTQNSLSTEWKKDWENNSG